ncbi:VOC family protein [Candidatus Villigracilis affinis]|uniref:VOC family protein n=1 Tax=Candidatus Villigracilis affinis TaxID=3140682 RepID=UPI001D85C4B5|nr:VOC family protein [Anaerolineales bacterium]
MNAQTNAAKTEFSIHPATKLGLVSLTVANLENQIQFYTQALGFKLHWREGNRAGLGAGGADLLLLTEEANLKRYRGVTGLYHFAVLFPNRRELARAVARLSVLKYRNYPTDHIMTKTTYLDDPEGNGIELYCESPEDGTFIIENDDFVTRRADGSWSDGREPLDVEALFSHLKEEDRLDDPLPAETRVGHVHLHVRNVQEAVDFYHGIIGFDVMGNSSSFKAAFISAGGYHHHLGLNAWKGEGAPPPPADAVGLRHFTVELPNQQALDEVVKRIDDAGIPSNKTDNGLLLYDPSQNGVVLKVG